MSNVRIGKVALTPKGAYDATATYDKLDVVQYEGSSYIVLQTATGITPEENEYYTLLCQGIGDITALDGIVTTEDYDGTIDAEVAVPILSVNSKRGYEIELSASDVGAASATHASQHASDGTDPITPDMIGAASNPNLLDNWYFADPINQRGQTEYTGYLYGIDRWFNNGGDIVTVVGDGYLECINNTTWAEGITQSLEPETVKRLIGHTVTASILLSDGTLGSATFEYPDQSGTAVHEPLAGNVSVYVNPSTNLHVFSVPAGQSYKAVAVKLELGSTQTLAHQENGNWVLNDPPPNKDLELLKCCMSTADSSDTHANNKKTAAQVGAVALEGTAITSDIDLLTLEKGVFCYEGTVPSGKNYPAVLVGTYQRCNISVTFPAGTITAGYREVALRTSYGQIFCNSQQYSSWTGWCELATTNYAVNKAGDTMSGPLKFFENKGLVNTQYSATSVMTYLQSIFDNTLYSLEVGNFGPRYFVGEVGNSWKTAYNILHTGNKPSGSYTGNGDATTRTIDTGGIGSVVAIISANGVAFVTPYVTLLCSATEAATTKGAAFGSGQVTIASANSLLNAQGVVYTYQVL